MKALSGLRLLDLSHMMAGPFGSMLLADLGMETIKIEPPGVGDGMRKMPPDESPYSYGGMGAYFLSLNRNKKGITLNLKSEAGRQVFYDLVRVSDVVLDNFSAGVTERLGVDYATLSSLNPRIITCSVTGFGSSGPGRDWTAFDLVAQGMGGIMSLTGQPGDPPTRAGLPVGDIGGGIMAALGILSALVARQQTGRGQHVDISMLDVQISLLNYVATMYLLSGIVPQAQGNGHLLHVPYNTFKTQDGWIIIAVILDPHWKALVRVLNLPDLDTPQHETAAGRSHSRDDINAQIAARLLTDSRDHWLEKLREVRVPCGPVYDVAEAVANPQVLHREMIVEIDHPLGGRVQIPGNPVKLSETGEDTFAPPPLLGEHTEAVLHDLLGKTEEEIAALREAGAF